LKTIKYICAVLCALLVVGTMPSIYLITIGLLNGSVTEGQSLYFGGKLAGYILISLLLGYAAFRFIKSTRSTR
jgi:hypothetical protein